MVCVFNKFKFFILFSYLIFLEVIAAVLWDESEAIQGAEQRIVLNCRASSDFAFRRDAVQSLVTNIQNNTQGFVPHTITWETHTPLSAMLSSILWIHDRKLSNRSAVAHPSMYVTRFERGAALLSGVESDPCPTFF